MESTKPPSFQSDLPLLVRAAAMICANTKRLRVLHACTIGGAQMACLISADLHVVSAELQKEAGRLCQRRAIA